MVCPATRAEALAQLAEFVPKAPVYARDRNHVRPGHLGVSRLSPAIRHRLISEDEVASAVLGAHSFSKVEKFVQEVYWRRYWKSWLSLRPQVWEAYQNDISLLQDDPRIRCIESLESGNRIIDHFTRELIETGYLHNHARMWYAAWWIHAARLPWQAGADLFLRHLLDGDPASNTLSWRWVAGLQTPGKTYLARRSNLEKYLTEEVLDSFEGHWQDFEVPSPHMPADAVSHAVTSRELSHFSMKEGLKSGLWIHEEDLSPETSPQGVCAADAILVTADLEFPSPKRNWLEQAVQDTASRAARHWKRDISTGTSAPPSDALLAWAVSHDLQQVIALRPDVGPIADKLPEIFHVLGKHHIHLALVDRPRDLALRPLATSGFFKFWETLQKKNLLPGHRRPVQPELF
jgi:deoxyribodipyrimidine photo-lyase